MNLSTGLSDDAEQNWEAEIRGGQTQRQNVLAFFFLQRRSYIYIYICMYVYIYVYV